MTDLKARMTISVVEARIVTAEGSRRLTKAMARQFLVDLQDGRDSRAMRGASRYADEPAPICKVRGKTLDYSTGWLILIEDPVAGYKWVRPADFREDYWPVVQKRGGWKDDLTAIPTVVL